MDSEIQVQVVGGHEFRNGKHDIDLCKLCVALTDEQAEKSHNPETCDACQEWIAAGEPDKA